MYIYYINIIYMYLIILYNNNKHFYLQFIKNNLMIINK